MRNSALILSLLFRRLGIALLILTLSRLLLYLLNSSYFSGLTVSILLGGLRYDLATMAMFFSPYILAQILLNEKRMGLLSKGLFHLSNSVVLLLNCIDLEYYKFTFKRTTWDFISFITVGDEVPGLLSQFLKDYWYIFLLFFAMIGLTEFLYRRSQKIPLPSFHFAWRFLWLLILTPLVVIAFRGGLQLRPLAVIQAGQYASSQNIPLVLNTPFTFVTSASSPPLRKAEYYSQEELVERYSPLQQMEGDSAFHPLNVVIIILESFSREYIGAYNEYEGYTPFMDSLMNHSLVAQNAYANGKKSIEALPAILSGLPNLMDNPYITSSYAGNRINSLASVLKTKNYHSSFFHGGANGTMGFNGYAAAAAFDQYFGMNEYPYKEDFDGQWGIFDAPYLQYVVEELDRSPKPFLSTIFTLSSHHPYTMPEGHENRYPKGKLNIHESIGYADEALKGFFAQAKSKDWFEETLFVLLADHTAQSEYADYQSRSGIFRMPLIFFHQGKLKGTYEGITQQADIFPSVLDYLDYEGEFVAFGNSIFGDEETYTVNLLNGLYQYSKGKYSLLFDGDQSTALYDLEQDMAHRHNLIETYPEQATEMEAELKAIIQQYNERLIQNRLIP